jgi:hypothetical protein
MNGLKAAQAVPGKLPLPQKGSPLLRILHDGNHLWKTRRRTRMTTDKNKLKTLNKLTDEGFDTEKKITSIDMRSSL